MNIPRKLFNLLREPWIRVTRGDGRQDCLSISQVFAQAHLLRGLSGELEAQDIAILRLLLAMLYAIFVPKDEQGHHNHLGDADGDEEAFTRWNALYKAGRFPEKVMEGSLLEMEDAFWLVHPERPFLQVPLEQSFISEDGKTPIYPTEKSLGSLIGEVAESAHKVRLFAGRRDEALPLPEAARWLVFLNSFDAAPGGTSKSGDGKTIKGFGVGWLGKLGLIWVRGETLFDTLMLNLVLASGQVRWDSCQPSWGSPQPFDPHALEDIEPAPPEDLCALYSYPFRRVRLHLNQAGDAVTGYQLWSGHALEPANFLLEPMTLWAKSKEENSYKPKLHQASRQMWRDFAAIFHAQSDSGPPPGVIQWVNRLKREGLYRDKLLNLGVCGIDYTNNTTIAHIFSDSLRVNAALLLEKSEACCAQIVSAIHDTNDLVYHLIILMRKLSLARGDDVNSARLEDAIDRAFFALDEPFRRWLAGIDPQTDDMAEALSAWARQARGIVRAMGQEMVSLSGRKAFVGRMVEQSARFEGAVHGQLKNFIQEGGQMRLPKPGGEREKRLYTAAKAYAEFLGKTAMPKTNQSQKEADDS